LLLIFDLDDTLVKTTETFTPHQLKAALIKMVQEGLAISDIDKAVHQIQALDKTSSSAKETLTIFLESYPDKERLFPIGLKEAYENFSFSHPIHAMDDASTILKNLSQSHILALVSAGLEHQQLTKLEKAGIDSTFFSKIAICRKEDKGIFYQSFSQEFGLSPNEVVVCGDRVDIDLLPAKALGFWTVQMLQGRGCQMISNKKEVDFTMTQLKDLSGILKQVTAGYIT
jgi:FMN phosphatase YigB (HAD superfamily)